MNDTPRTNKYIHINTTQQLLEAVICDCRNNITSDGSAVLDGYVDLDENARKVADACWFDGMDRMGSEILAWAEDKIHESQGWEQRAGDYASELQKVGDKLRRALERAQKAEAEVEVYKDLATKAYKSVRITQSPEIYPRGDWFREMHELLLKTTN